MHVGSTTAERKPSSRHGAAPTELKRVSSVAQRCQAMPATARARACSAAARVNRLRSFGTLQRTGLRTHLVAEGPRHSETGEHHVLQPHALRADRLAWQRSLLRECRLAATAQPHCSPAALLTGHRHTVSATAARHVRCSITVITTGRIGSAVCAGTVAHRRRCMLRQGRGCARWCVCALWTQQPEERAAGAGRHCVALP